MARSAEASMVVPLLHQCEDVHLEGVVVGGHPAEHVLELLVLFVQAPNLGFGQCQLIMFLVRSKSDTKRHQP